MAATSVFDEILFPLGISYGSQGGPEYRTAVVPAASGYEQRQGAWANGRLTWDVSKGLQKPEQVTQLIAFFRARKGRLRAFRFRDPLDNKATNEALPNTGGTVLQLQKVYLSGPIAEVRCIQKPSPGTVTLTLNGANWPAPGNWALDTTTGLVTLAQAQPGAVIAWSGVFDMPARFDTDMMNLRADDLYAAWESIKVVEVFLP